jgi:hypothetical protein
MYPAMSNKAAAALGKLGGSKNSEAQRAARSRNFALARQRWIDKRAAEKAKRQKIAQKSRQFRRELRHGKMGVSVKK